MRHGLFKTIFFLLGCLWTREWRTRLQLIAAIGCTGCSVGLTIVSPMLLKWLIDGLSGASLSATSVYLLCVAYGGAWFLSQATHRCEEYLFVVVNERIKRTITLNYVSRVLGQPAAALSAHQTGASVSELTRVQDSAMRAIIGLFWSLAPICVEIVVVGIVVCSLFGWVYAAVLLGILTLYLYLSVATAKRCEVLQRKKNRASDRASTRLVDTLTHADTVKAFSNEASELARLNRVFKMRAWASIHIARKMEIVGAAQLLIVGIGLTALTALAGRDILAHRLTIGDFVLLNSYLLRFTLPLSTFGYMLRGIQIGLFNLSELLHTICVRWRFDPLGQPLFEQAPSIEFRNASFCHPCGRRVLRHANFSIPAGAFCALVGSSGAGKSTLIKLLLRLYKLDEGQILIEGQPIESFSESQLRQSIGYVTQEAHLLDRSIRENICFAYPQASDSELESVIQTCALTPVIAAASQGLDTSIGERGNKLSGGERQRVGLARALLRNSPLLLLDEPTAALDAHTEADIFKHLYERYRHTTRLVIAHRLAAIQQADLILVMQEGAIVETGTHRSLLAQQGVYANLWHKQAHSSAARPDRIDSAETVDA
ncbi:ABC transporter ATP-binding protein/permease [Mycetohabitans sp. B2]|uniref:ATP-binding cassette transporter n=1 Tax=Mycetohabitans sp. TaxID=2571162 RepID=A0A6B9HDB4_9BURK|nr:ABC transporter ATP-binding protein [Mycetohabitans sp. B2]MCF7695627.1 ABC transporter ATP-binding protein/permease [Mycetohabitans sp. B2]QGY72752.1 ATP-binding cassette transporter [Mycetohabitans sp.]